MRFGHDGDDGFGDGFWFGVRFRLIFDEFAVAIGDAAGVDVDVFEHLPDVFVAGEDEQLVAFLGEFLENVAGGAGAACVVVDEDVVEDHRQVDAAAGVGSDQRQAEAHEELLAGAAAEDLNGEGLAFGVVDEENVVGERRPDAFVLAAGELGHVLAGFAKCFGLAVLFVLVADAVEEEADGGPLAPGVDRFLDLQLDDIELDLFLGERLFGGGGALLLDHRAAALKSVLKDAVELFGLRGEGFPIVFETADLVVGEVGGEIRFGAVLADGGDDFAGSGGAFGAELFGFDVLGGKSAEFLFVGDAAFLEEGFAAAAMADGGVVMFDRFDFEGLRTVADALALFDALLVFVVFAADVVELFEWVDCSWGLDPGWLRIASGLFSACEEPASERPAQGRRRPFLRPA